LDLALASWKAARRRSVDAGECAAAAFVASAASTVGRAHRQNMANPAISGRAERSVSRKILPGERNMSAEARGPRGRKS